MKVSLAFVDREVEARQMFLQRDHHVADRVHGLCWWAEVKGLVVEFWTNRQFGAELEISTDRFEDVLPRARCLRATDGDVLSRSPCFRDVDHQTVGSPIAAANNVASAGDANAHVAFVVGLTEERTGMARDHDFGARL